MDSSIRDWLIKHSLRITVGRMAVVRLLRKEPVPITLTDLHSKLHSLDFATVFRFIKLLEGKNLLVRHTWDDGSLRYALHSDEAHDCHHHYLICRSCKRAEELDVCTVERMEKDLKYRKGYRDLSHSLQFFGICPDCQSPKKPASHRHTSNCRH